MQPILPLSSSYRDNAGFVFADGRKFYRCINECYFPFYDMLLQSGLYDELTIAGRLIPHEEVSNSYFPGSASRKIILPEQIPFISYPYEWPFDMWRDAAIVTLKIMQVAMGKGMILKDATPFNIQFYKGRPVFIDTLSFIKYEAGRPWIAYRQFCESFLGPLLLMHYGHRDMGKLFIAFPDGIPLQVIKELLPVRAKFNVHVYMHIQLQESMSRKKNNTEKPAKTFTKEKLIVLIQGLLDLVTSLRQKENRSVWDNYYSETILGDDYLVSKDKIIRGFTEAVPFKNVIDLGANDGHFSFLLKDKATNIISVDFDSNCINALYREIRKNRIKNIIPLVSSFNAPSPAIGWNNSERPALTERLKGDLILALALVHHLAISVNVPLAAIAEWLLQMGPYLVIEFIPKSDEKVKELLLHREDIFTQHNPEQFKISFAMYYDILQEQKVGNTDRILFLMQRKSQ